MNSKSQRFLVILIMLVVCLPSSLWAAKQSVQRLLINGKVGLVNAKGEVLIPANYDDIGWADGSLDIVDNVIAYKEKHYWGLIDLNNHQLTFSVYTSLVPFQDELIIAGRRVPASLNIEYGLINTKGKTTLSFQYDYMEAVGDKLIVRKENRGYGLVNKNATPDIALSYQEINACSEDMVEVIDTTGRASLYRTNGKRLSRYLMDSIGMFDKGTAPVYFDGKVGLMDKNGREVLSADYKQVVKDSKRHVKVLPFSSWFLFTGENEKLYEYKYDSVMVLAPNLYKSIIEDKQGIIFKDGHKLSKIKPCEIGAFVQGVAPYTYENKTGMINDKGEVFLSPSFSSLMFTEQNIITQNRSQGKIVCSIYDMEGKLISDKKYAEVRTEDDQLFCVRKNKYWGFIDADGQEIIQCKFDSVQFFEDGKAKVHYLDGQGYIDKEGNWLIMPYQHYLEELGLNVYLYRKGKKSGIMNRACDDIYTTPYQLIKREYSIIEKGVDGKVGLLNLKGRSLLYPEYTYISELMADQYYVVKKEGAWGILRKSGHWAIPLAKKYQEIHAYSEGYFGVKIDNKYGFIDHVGNLYIANQYDSIGRLVEGMCPVKLRGKWGFVDKLESLKVQPLYDEVGDFRHAIAIVKKKGKYGLIDNEGEEVSSFVFDLIQRTASGNYITLKNGKQGMVNGDGKQVVNAKFDHIKDTGKGYAIIMRNKKYGLVRYDGVSTVPMMYDQVIYDDINDVFLVAQHYDWLNFTIKVK